MTERESVSVQVVDGKFARMIEKHRDGIEAYCRLEKKVSPGFVRLFSPGFQMSRFIAFKFATNPEFALSKHDVLFARAPFVGQVAEAFPGLNFPERVIVFACSCSGVEFASEILVVCSNRPINKVCTGSIAGVIPGLSESLWRQRCTV